MGVSPSLMVPAWQVDTDNRYRYANPVVRTALKERLLQENYNESIKEAGEVNLALKEAVLSVVGTRHIDSDLETDTTEELEAEGSTMTKRRIALECIIGFMSRLRNPNIHNFFIVILSVVALGSNVSVEFWSLLTMMGLAFSRRWTINLVRETGDNIAGTKPEGSSANVRLAVTDIKGYFAKSVLVHAVEVEGVANAPRILNGHFLYTVNNLQVPLHIPHFDILPGIH